MTISHSFTIDEAKKTKNTELLVRCFDINSDPTYKLEKTKDTFNKDANRSAMLLLETPNGKVVDLIEATLKDQKITQKDIKLNYYDLVSAKLQKDYKLSDKQAEYVLSSSHQGGIGGGIAGFGATIIPQDPNALTSTKLHQLVAPKVTISKDGSVSLSSVSKITYDTPQQADQSHAPILSNHIAYNEYLSNDHLYTKITANLGKTNQSQETKPIITIDMTGTGKHASTAINQFKENIQSNLPTKSLEDLKNDYSTKTANITAVADASTFEKSTYTGANKQYQEQLRENINNVLSDTKNPKSLNLETLKRFPQTKTELAGILVDKVDKQLNSLKGNNQAIKQTQLTKIGEDLAKDLSKFTDDKSQGAVKLFSKELVSQRASEQGMKLPKQNFISKIVTKLKEMWHGVSTKSIDKQKNMTQNVKEMINNFSQKHHNSAKTPTHVINHKENTKNSKAPHR